MNKFAKSLLAVAVAAGTFGATAAVAEVTANVGATSNYLWRGATQAGEGPAVSGGIDYANESGFYVGGWTANESWTAAPGYELDVYGGFAGEMSGISYDLGAITYLYPVGDGEDDFSEFYVNLGFGAVTATVAYTFSKESDLDTGDIYLSLGGGFDVSEGLSAGVLVGSYTFADDTLEDFDYTHFQASLTKSLSDYGDVTFALDKTAMDEDFWGEGASDPRVSVSWSKSFDL